MQLQTGGAGRVRSTSGLAEWVTAMCWPNDLSLEWRELALQQRDLGAEPQARTLEWCADELEEHFRAWRSELLTLEEASEESGYSRDHLGRLLSDGVIPNAGEPYGPHIRRQDLPRKPGHQVEHRTSRLDDPVPSRVQVARSVVNSD